jgi:hypothetical protein
MDCFYRLRECPFIGGEMIDTQKLRNSLPYNNEYAILPRAELEEALAELDSLRLKVAELTAPKDYLYQETMERNHEHVCRY